jgi:hypothetical protein
MSGLVLVPERDNETKNIIVWHVQDVEPIVERNKRMAKERPFQNDYLEYYACVPNIYLFKWWMEDTGGDPAWPIYSQRYFNTFVAKRLEDPQWRAFRVDIGPRFRTGWKRNGS